MLMVGNVGVNRVRGECLDLKNNTKLQRMVYQRPGGFEARLKGTFIKLLSEKELKLARRVIKGERFHPASNSLWFFRPTGSCPAKWFIRAL